MQKIKRFCSCERGVETVEYAIIVGLIVVGVIATIASVATLVNDRFVALEAEITASNLQPLV